VVGQFEQGDAPLVERALVVVNPIARRGASRLLEKLKATAPATVDWRVVETRPTSFRFGELEHEARSADVVVAVGGDGTVAETVTAVGNAPAPIAIVPGGSTNVIAHEIGAPINPTEVGHLIFGHHDIRTMDAATCNGRLFLHMAGAGFDSRIFDQTNATLKRRAGWIAYLPGAARSLRLPPARFHVRTDHAEMDFVSPMVLVANGAGIIRPSLALLPDITSVDGMLDMVAVTAIGGTQIVSVIGRFLTKSLQRSPHVLHVRTTRIRIEADPPMPVQLDGDVVGSTPAEMEILPRRARLLVPVRKGNSAGTTTGG
jgi:diacylglycerol kinase (ATP)